jgi:hypothetical protein
MKDLLVLYVLYVQSSTSVKSLAKSVSEVSLKGSDSKADLVQDQSPRTVTGTHGSAVDRAGELFSMVGMRGWWLQHQYPDTVTVVHGFVDYTITTRKGVATLFSTSSRSGTDLVVQDQLQSVTSAEQVGHCGLHSAYQQGSLKEEVAEYGQGL